MAWPWSHYVALSLAWQTVAHPTESKHHWQSMHTTFLASEALCAIALHTVTLGRHLVCQRETYPEAMLPGQTLSTLHVAEAWHDHTA